MQPAGKRERPVNQARPIDAQGKEVAFSLSTGKPLPGSAGVKKRRASDRAGSGLADASVRLRSRAVFDDHLPLPKVETQRLCRAESEIASYLEE